MLFLLRPPQTWMPFERPQDPMAQDADDDATRRTYAATQRVPAYQPSGAAAPDDVVAKLQDLGDLHRAGSLTDEEFATAKAKLLATADTAT